jgi:hypothetical protein
MECEACEGEGYRPFPMVTADWREAWTECHVCDTDGTIECPDCADEIARQAWDDAAREDAYEARNERY